MFERLAAGAGRPNVLIVDDEPLVLKVLHGVLSNRGYAVSSVSSGEEALDLVSSTGAPIDVLLTDVAMPGMNGVELAQRLTNARPGVRVLFIAGMPDTPDIRAGVLNCGFALLPKPFLPAELDAKIQEVLAAPLARVAAL